MIEHVSFGDALRYHRVRSLDPVMTRTLTQERLGELIGRELGDEGYSGGAISEWERGRSSPSQKEFPVLIALIKVFANHGGMNSVAEANSFLAAGNYRNLTQDECRAIFGVDRANEINHEVSPSASPASDFLSTRVREAIEMFMPSGKISRIVTLWEWLNDYWNVLVTRSNLSIGLGIAVALIFVISAIVDVRDFLGIFAAIDNDNVTPTISLLSPGVSSTPIITEAVTPNTLITSICGGGEIAPLEKEQERFLNTIGAIQYNTATTPTLLSNRIRTIAIDERGVWIGFYSESGTGEIIDITVLSTLGWEVCHSEDIDIGREINDIVIDSQGIVWIARDNYGVVRFDGEVWEEFRYFDGSLPSDDTYYIFIDEEDGAWFGTYDGVAMFDGFLWSVPYTNRNRDEELNDNILYNETHDITFHPSGEVWIAHIENGLERLTADGEWVLYQSIEGEETKEKTLLTNKVRAIQIDLDGNVWIGTEGGGISFYSYQTDEWNIYTTENSALPDNGVSDLEIDKHGRVWAATRSGTAYFSSGEWHSYSDLETLTIAFGPECEDCLFDDEHVWSGTNGFGILHHKLPPLKPVIEVVSVDYPIEVQPGELFTPEITVKVLPGFTLDDKGDFLHFTGENEVNRFGAHPLLAVYRTVHAGETYTFVDMSTPFMAPQEPGIYQSTWRIWQDTRYVGPEIVIEFTVISP